MFSKTVHNTLVIGLLAQMKFAMDTVFKYGQMVPAMKVTGVTIKLMEEALSGTFMVTNTLETGKMIKPTVKEFIFMLMVQNMMDSG